MNQENTNEPLSKTAVMPSLQSLNFRDMRKSKGLTLRKVESLTGISNPYLSQLETGKINNPSYDIVRKLFLLYSNVPLLQDACGLDSRVVFAERIYDDST